jgi:hypothetical protein
MRPAAGKAAIFYFYEKPLVKFYFFSIKIPSFKKRAKSIFPEEHTIRPVAITKTYCYMKTFFNPR